MTASLKSRLPVHHLSEIDALGRSAFARHLLDVVLTLDSQANGAVMALTGEWGSGKSWAVEQAHRLAKAMPDENRPLWINFSPWTLSGTPQLIEAMLTELAMQLQLGAIAGTPADSVKRATEVGERLLDFASVLAKAKYVVPFLVSYSPTAAMVVGGVAAGADAISDKKRSLQKGFQALRAWAQKRGGKKEEPQQPASLQAARQRVCEALCKLDRTVVVVIDDVDRMAPKEVAEIMQTVKAVANFPNVVYVLTYDPQVVKHALEVALQVEDGDHYLEKVVQVAMPLPEAPLYKLSQQVDRLLADALAYAEWVPMPVEQADLDEPLNATHQVLGLVRTPRDLVRLRVGVMQSFKHLKDDICPGDLLLLTALQLMAPKVIDWVDKHRAQVLCAEELSMSVLHTARHDVPSIRSAGQAERKRLTEEWKAELQKVVTDSCDRPHAVHAALLFLFDTVHETEKRQRMLVNHKRSQYLANWLQWRAIVNHDGLYSRPRIQRMLNDPDGMECGGFMASPDRFLEFLTLADPVLRDGEGFNLLAAIELLSRAAARFDFSSSGVLGQVRHPTRVLSQLVGKVKASDVELAVKSMMAHKVVGPAGGLLRKARLGFIDGLTRDDVAHLVAFWLPLAYGSLNDSMFLAYRADNPLSIVRCMSEFDPSPSNVAGAVAASLTSPNGIPIGWWLSGPDDVHAIEDMAAMQAMPGPQVWLDMAAAKPAEMSHGVLEAIVEWKDRREKSSSDGDAGSK